MSSDRAEEIDLLVIGAGSGNSLPDPAWGDRSVLVADDAPWFGGTCLNVGCIPTKMFVHVADLLRDARDGERLGLRDVTGRVDWPAVRDRVFGRIDSISASGERYRASGEPNIGLLRERVEFVGPRTVRSASGRVIEAGRVVVAAGSRPRELDALPFGSFDGRVLSSNEIMRIDELPRRLVVVGGGVVATEFASMFHGMGVEVVQLARSPLLRRYDADLSTRFTEIAGSAWTVRTDVDDIRPSEVDGAIHLELSDGDAFDTDLVLVAIGRIPNTDTLATRDVGFDHHEDGRLVVDRFQRVLAGGEPVDGVFALGDIDSAHQLKHVANEEARVVQRNVFADGDLTANTLGPIPHAVFSNPQVAVFGRTLEQAIGDDVDAFEVVHELGWTAWGWALEDTTSFVKLVVERERGTLLGAHLVGPDAAVLIQPLVMAASLGLSVRGLARAQYWPHPAASEVVENALLRAEEEL